MTTTVGITAINDAPTLSSVATSATFTEKGAAVTLSGAASVADPDNQNLASATVKIVGGTFAGDGDQLAVNVAGTSIVGVYNVGTETLTLTGSDTLAHYQQVLDSLTFNSTSLNPANYGSNTDPHGHLGAQRRQRLEQPSATRPRRSPSRRSTTRRP